MIRTKLLVILCGTVVLAGSFMAGNSAVSAADVPALDIKDDEELDFFPSYAYYDEKANLYRIQIHAWAFEPARESKKRRLLIALLEHELGIGDDVVASETFKKRAGYLLVDQTSRKYVAIRVGNDSYNVGVTDSNGHTERTLGFPESIFSPFISGKLDGDGKGGGVEFTYDATSRRDGSRTFIGKTRYIPLRGFSVISDIDDTIKISEVGDKSKLMENTLVKPFVAVDGMAQLYRGWKEKGAEFHYVTASPWQLFPLLSEFITSAGFPEGLFMMRSFGITANPMAYSEKSEAIKLPHIKLLMKHFPKRRFILVGDSGEKDPEIYGMIARENPGRVIRICIRNVNGETRTSARMQAAFTGLPDDLWVLFGNPSEIPRDIPAE
jgi:hypothetical protein